MHTAVIIPFRGNPATLSWVLDGFARQQLPPGHTVDVRLGADGSDLPATPASTPAVRFTALTFPRVGISEAKNRLMEGVSADVFLFVNGDTRPGPAFVAVHTERLLSLPEGHMVLGASPYVQPAGVPETVFDVLKRDTPMIFFYANMAPRQLYDYRHAWNMNVSVRPADVRRAGGFAARLRPVFYDDIELAFRVMGTEKRVYFDPAAAVEHDHPMTFDQYLMREELLGLMAPALADINPAMFANLFGGQSVDALAAQFRVWTAMDASAHAWAYTRLAEWTPLPSAALGVAGSPERQRLVNALYQLHIPLKRLAFRLGFLHGLDLRGDDRWQARQPTGLWKPIACPGS